MEEPALPIDKPINDGEPEEPIDPERMEMGPPEIHLRQTIKTETTIAIRNLRREIS